MTNIPETIREAYQTRFKRFGVSAQALKWSSRGAAHQRFRQIWSEIDFSNKSVLDVGCGFGELGKFLTKKYSNVSYTGIDITPEFIENAKKMHPTLNFICGDYFGNPLSQKFDVIVCSGALNVNITHNSDYRYEAIKTMYTHANKTVVFNMLGGHPQPQSKKESNVWYADSLEVLKFCFTLTPRVILRHQYHPKDFTIFMYKSTRDKS